VRRFVSAAKIQKNPDTQKNNGEKFCTWTYGVGVLLIYKVSADDDEFVTSFSQKRIHKMQLKAFMNSFLSKISRNRGRTELYKKYGLTDEEIQFIESMIRPME